MSVFGTGALLLVFSLLGAAPRESGAGPLDGLGVTATGSCSGTDLAGSPFTETMKAEVWAIRGSNDLTRVESVDIGGAFVIVLWATVDTPGSSSTYTYSIAGQPGSGTFYGSVDKVEIPVTATQAGEIVVVFTPVAKGFQSCGATATATLTVKVNPDTAKPVLSGLQPATAVPGARATFRYATADALGETQEVIGVYRSRSDAKPIATFQTKWGRTGAVRVTWKVPSRLRAGAYVWCAVSRDRAGNASRSRCARLVLTG